MDAMSQLLIFLAYLAIGWPIAKHLIRRAQQDPDSSLKKRLDWCKNCEKEFSLEKEEYVGRLFKILWLSWIFQLSHFYLEKIGRRANKEFLKKIQKL
jgi:hypothetical protein